MLVKNGVAKLQVGSSVLRAKKGPYILNSGAGGAGRVIKRRIKHVRFRCQCPYLRLYWNMTTPIP